MIVGKLVLALFASLFFLGSFIEARDNEDYVFPCVLAVLAIGCVLTIVYA